mmetsp:Transcript_19290/g.35454  ORF Transcript_19290/g.35454 Transcript_19290/m.35454 type:complete len:489 (-) Transcript_19290:48-1514(-)
MSRIDSLINNHAEKLNLFEGYFFTVNAVMGAGFLNIPWAFQTGGWVVGLLSQVIFALQSYWLFRMLLETLSRGEVIATKSIERDELKQVAFKDLCKGSYERPERLMTTHEYSNFSCLPDITDRRRDCTEIVRLIFGRKWAGAYLFMMTLFYIGALTAYTAIFASSFASNVPLGPLDTCNIYEDASFGGDCRWKYWLYLALFTVIEVALVLASYSEQKWMQTCMTIIRITVVLAIVLTSLVSVITGTKISGGGSHTASYEGPAYPLAIAGSILVTQFAYLCHIQVPSIAQFVQDRKRNLPKISLMVTMTCFLAYTSLGLIVPAAIDNVPGLVTLSFRNYSAGYSTRPWWTFIISYIIVLCPALDVVSSYPIIAVSVAQNILSFIYPGEKSELYNPKRVLALKLAIAIFPACISFFEYDLSVILSWTTYMGLLVMPVAIPIMYMGSRILNDLESPFKAVGTGPVFTMVNVVGELILILFLFTFSILVLII